jgi:hypothetical protein
MALLTTLALSGSQYQYKVADFRCRFVRRYNQFNPESAPCCDCIEMTVIAPDTDDYTFYEWYINRSIMSGKLIYELPVTVSSNMEVRKIEFKDAQCFSIKEDYDIDKDSRRLLTLSIVPEKVSMDNVSFAHL